MYVILPHNDFGKDPNYLYISVFSMLYQKQLRGIYKDTNTNKMYIIFECEPAMERSLNNLIHITEKSGTKIEVKKVEEIPPDLVYCAEIYGWLDGENNCHCMK